MDKLTKIEKELIDNYSRDFYSKTHKTLQINILTEWEALCKLDTRVPTTTLLGLIEGATDWDLDKVFSAGQKREEVIKRQLVFFILFQNGITMRKIGRLAGGKDHSTISMALESFEVKLENEKYVGKMLREVMESIKNSVELFQ